MPSRPATTCAKCVRPMNTLSTLISITRCSCHDDDDPPPAPAGDRQGPCHRHGGGLPARRSLRSRERLSDAKFATPASDRPVLRHAVGGARSNVGAKRALDMLFTGRAGQAPRSPLRDGLLSRVVPPAELDAAPMALARTYRRQTAAVVLGRRQGAVPQAHGDGSRTGLRHANAFYMAGALHARGRQRSELTPS